MRDISLRKKADRRLRYLAYHDKLTSLGNRDRFAETLTRVLEEVTSEPDRHGALLYLDLDGFKKVNDSLGHEIGDAILKACAKRLGNSLREGDQVYRFNFEEIFRLGGDEFTILLPFVRKPEDAAIVARRVIDKITEPFAIDNPHIGGDINLGVSIGIAIIPRDGTDPTTLLRNADAAMYRAKDRGNRFMFFTDDMNDMAVERLLIEQGLRRALTKNEFELYYQPIVDSDGIITTIEALVRWNHPERGILAPGAFISVLEEIDLMGPFGTWALSRACHDLVKIKEVYKRDIRVSVNISPAQLEREEMAEIIRNTLNRRELSDSDLMIELTESAVMKNPELAIRKLNAIKRLNPGVAIAIDDFGTGYSSLAYLTSYPVDILKIDRSFVMKMHTGDNAKIVKTIVDLGIILDLSVVAEGVENEEQFMALKKYKCDLFQGFYLYKPLPLSDLTTVLAERAE